MTAVGPGLVAVAEQDAPTAGAGIVSSLHDLGDAFGGGDAGEVFAAAVPAGLDLLGAIDDPFGALTGAGVGWILEHVGFLREFLDWFAGDPEQIIAQAQTWHRISGELTAVAGQHRAQADSLQGWDGAASAAYRGAVTTHVDGLRAAAADALELSDRILVTGAHVGVVRALIRDVISDLIGRLLRWAATALASSVVSAGASVAAYAAAAVSEAITATGRILARVADLLDELVEAARALAATVDRIDEAAALLDRGGSGMSRAVGGTAALDVRDELAGVARSAAQTALTEPAKQQEQAEAAPREWGDDRPRDWARMVQQNR
jgi:hypothetical protein